MSRMLQPDDNRRHATPVISKELPSPMAQSWPPCDLGSSHGTGYREQVTMYAPAKRRRRDQLNSPETYSLVRCSFGASRSSWVGPYSTRYPVRPPCVVST